VSAPAGNLLLDTITGDLAMVNGNLVIASGPDAVRQEVVSRLSFFAGEWFADESIGMPYWDRILGQKTVPLFAVREIFRSAIAETPGIASVDSIDLAYAAPRNAVLTFSATTDDGTQISVNGMQLGDQIL
jgi:hypothetical protein